jgi:hypothetical protein
LGLLAGKPRRLVWRVGILLTYVLGMWWLGTHRLERFLVPALPLAAFLAGLGAAWFATHTGHGVLSGIVAVGLVANLLFSLGSRDQDHRYLVGLKQLRRDEPAEPNGPSRVDRVHRYLNDTVADGDSVLLVGDAQPFDLEVPALYNTCFDDCQFELLLKGRSRAERLAAFRERRISYVYVHWSEIRRYRSPGNYGFTDYVTHDRLRELVVEQGLLRPLDLGLDPQLAEVFAVVDVRP